MTAITATPRSQKNYLFNPMPAQKQLPQCKDCVNYTPRWQYTDKDGEAGDCKKYPQGVFRPTSCCERYFEPKVKREI
jgi:hypothetical protein